MHTLNLLPATFYLLLSPCSSYLFAIHYLLLFSLLLFISIFFFPVLPLGTPIPLHFSFLLVCFYTLLLFTLILKSSKSVFTLPSWLGLLLIFPLCLFLFWQILSLVSFKCFSLYSCKLARFISIIFTNT